VRLPALLLAVAACHKDGAQPPRDAALPAVRDAAPADGYADLTAALRAILPQDARVLGFGELHARTDRAQVESALAHFTREALPFLGDRLSDLVVETWIVDKTCGATAEAATAKVTSTMRRPAATRSEIAALADAARARGIQPHAMHVGCDDYAKIAPPGKEVDAEAMLTLTTRELGRIATEAVQHRDGEPGHRPWIAIYGGALHNDLSPAKGVEEWSYAAKVDAATRGHFVEIDVIVPELAELDAASQQQPWFALVRTADARVHVWKRGERSFVVVLARSP
jgi:hypothetical protein